MYQYVKENNNLSIFTNLLCLIIRLTISTL
jgi:hypothetical protein